VCYHDNPDNCACRKSKRGCCLTRRQNMRLTCPQAT
jgi:hypothetical protein